VGIPRGMMDYPQTEQRLLLTCLLPKPEFGYSITIFVYLTPENSYHTFASNHSTNSPYRTVSTNMVYTPEKKGNTMYIIVARYCL
jgi:hypothetical protein